MNNEYRPIVPRSINPHRRVFPVDMNFKQGVFLGKHQGYKFEEMRLPVKQKAMLREILEAPGIDRIYISPKKVGRCGAKRTTYEIEISKGEAFSWEKPNRHLRRIFQQYGLGFLIYDSPRLFRMPQAMVVFESHAILVFSVNREIYDEERREFRRGEWEDEPGIREKLGKKCQLIQEAYELFYTGSVFLSSYDFLVMKGCNPGDAAVQRLLELLEESIREQYGQ
jgi:hypothetical protein